MNVGAGVWGAGSQKELLTLENWAAAAGSGVLVCTACGITLNEGK